MGLRSCKSVLLPTFTKKTGRKLLYTCNQKRFQFSDSIVVGCSIGAKKMVARVKTYGRKGRSTGELSDEFAALSLGGEGEQREVLGEVATNVPARRRARTKAVKGKDASSSADRQLPSRPGPPPPPPPPQEQEPGTGEGPEEYLRPLTEVTGAVADFAPWAETIFEHFDVAKIGDGSYADVFKVTPKAKSSETPLVISKLIPLRPMFKPRGLKWKDMSTVEDALSEIRLLDAMTEIPGFVEFRSAKVLRGCMPEPLKDACTAYYEARRYLVNSEVTKPRIHYRADQLWLVIEMSDAGADLDTLLREGDASGTLPLRIDKKSKEKRLDIRQTRDLFWATANALAHGEEEAKFEHRDLHLSNICIKKDKERVADNSYAFVPESSDRVVTLIDYTLSRAGTADKLIFNPMNDAEIFTGQDDLQFEIYRYMRKAVKVGRKAQWDAFVPLTNVLWLHHLLAKLLEKTAPADTEALPAQTLWTSFEGLRDDTDPDKMSGEWTYLSAMDIVAMGKVGET